MVDKAAKPYCSGVCADAETKSLTPQGSAQGQEKGSNARDRGRMAYAEQLAGRTGGISGPQIHYDDAAIERLLDRQVPSKSASSHHTAFPAQPKLSSAYYKLSVRIRDNAAWLQS